MTNYSVLGVTSINIGMLGLGVVGSSTVNLLNENHSEMVRRTGCDFVVRKVAILDLKKPRNCPTENLILTDDPLDVVNDPEIDIIVELMGGESQTAEYLLKAIANGKHIVTANKALIAKYGHDIFLSAHEKNIIVAFEAAVGGGIPIVKVLREGLAGNKIDSLVAVLNGTCNYILTKMQNDGLTLVDALKEAQQLGYAEADPSADIEGIDAAQKLTILASLAFGISLRYSNIYVEGITDISPLDLTYAKKLGFVIKHLAYAQKTAQSVYLHVYPMMISHTHPLANIYGVMNGILVNANAVGQTLYYGAGAGGAPTASAVVADLIDVIRSMAIKHSHRVPYLAFHSHTVVDYPVITMNEYQFCYYLRFQTKNKQVEIEQLMALGKRLKIKFLKIEQIENFIQSNETSLVLVTEKISEPMVDQVMSGIKLLIEIVGNVTKIRIDNEASLISSSAILD